MNKKKTTLAIRIDEDLKEGIKSYCDKERRSVSGMVNKLIEEFLEKLKAQEQDKK